MYYHIDKSGLIKSNLLEHNNSKYIITGSLSLNGFPYGFMTLENLVLVPNILNDSIYKLISDFFKTRNLKFIKKIILELTLNSFLSNNTYVQRLLREIIFEVERLNNFPSKPSRLSCIYLIEKNKDIELWAEYLKISIDNKITYKLSPEKPQIFKTENLKIIESVHRADTKWLEINTDNITNIYKNAHNYWLSNMTIKPMIEILYYGVLKLIENDLNNSEDQETL
jgi:hypothetical protein